MTTKQTENKLEVIEVKKDGEDTVKVYAVNSKELATRLHTAREEMRLRGEWVGGRIPFGYRSKRGYLVIDKTEAKFIRRAFELRFIEHKSKADVHKILVEEGCVTVDKKLEDRTGEADPNPKPLNRTALYRFFEDERINLYLGLKGGEAIITEHHLGKGTPPRD